MDNDFTTSALSWLYDMEILSSPTVLTNLRENILLSHKRIKNCEILIIEDRQDLMVFIEVTRLGLFFKKEKDIEYSVQQILNKMLPNFRKRIVFDKEVFDKAITSVKKHYGGRDGKTINQSDNDPGSGNNSSS